VYRYAEEEVSGSFKRCPLLAYEGFKDPSKVGGWMPLFITLLRSQNTVQLMTASMFHVQAGLYKPI
jgi:hypothetical protein